MKYLEGIDEQLQRDLINIKNNYQSRGFRYELLDKNDNLKKELTNVSRTGCFIDMNNFAQVKRSGVIFFNEDDPDIDWINDRIKPYVTISDGITSLEYPLGVYLLSSPTVTYTAQNDVRRVEVYSKLQILKEDKITDRLTLEAGTQYTVNIVNIITSTGISKVQVLPSTLTLNRAIEYPIGTPKLTIVNDLLSQINYYSLSSDNEGFVVSSPYVNVNERSVTYSYLDNRTSIVYNDVTEELNLFDVPNVFVVVASNAETSPLKSTFVNNSITDPTSVVNRGRQIVSYNTVSDVADQATLDALTERLADELNDVYGYVTFNTSINPLHEFLETLEFTYRGISATFTEVSWKIELSNNGVMRHECRRLINA